MFLINASRDAFHHSIEKKKDMSLNKRAIYTLLDSKDSNFIFGIIDIDKLKNK